MCAVGQHASTSEGVMSAGKAESELCSAGQQCYACGAAPKPISFCCCNPHQPFGPTCNPVDTQTCRGVDPHLPGCETSCTRIHVCCKPQFYQVPGENICLRYDLRLRPRSVAAAGEPGACVHTCKRGAASERLVAGRSALWLGQQVFCSTAQHPANRS